MFACTSSKETYVRSRTSMSGAVNEAFSCYVQKTNARLNFASKSWFSEINKSSPMNVTVVSQHGGKLLQSRSSQFEEDQLWLLEEALTGRCIGRKAWFQCSTCGTCSAQSFFCSLVVLGCQLCGSLTRLPSAPGTMRPFLLKVPGCYCSTNI